MDSQDILAKIKEQKQKLIKDDRELVENILDLLTWHNCAGECGCDTCKAAIWYLKLKKEII